MTVPTEIPPLRPARQERAVGSVAYRAPREDGAILAVPPLEEAAALLERNARIVQAAAAVNVQGRSLGRLRQWGREEVFRRAVEYTGRLLGTPIDVAAAETWFVSGHQPALVHPGVWAKHFALAALAERHGGTALNLVVDNDVLSSTTLSVPRGPREQPWINRVPLLPIQSPRPWEEIRIEDVEMFTSFGSEVSNRIEQDWKYRPLMADTWRDAVAAHETFPRLADCLTAMRRRQEERWGIHNLELPLSEVASTAPFRWFASHLLVEAPRFRDVHNDVLHEYRRVNRIRSRSHPVAELATRDGWTETPFRVWRTGETHRGRLFVRQSGKQLELANGTASFGSLRIHPGSEACCAVEDLAALSEQGWKFRTRALTTTLFSRLCLADVFIHGIGGAKYDEMTDRIVEQFFGIQPPEFITLTATLRLPLHPFDVTANAERSLRSKLRELEFNADRVLLRDAAAGTVAANDSDLRLLQEEKRQLIADGETVRRMPLSRRERRERRPENRRRDRRLREINALLSARASAERQKVEQQLDEVRQQLEANRILASREFAWGLFPEESLRTLASRMTSLP